MTYGTTTHKTCKHPIRLDTFRCQSTTGQAVLRVSLIFNKHSAFFFLFLSHTYIHNMCRQIYYERLTFYPCLHCAYNTGTEIILIRKDIRKNNSTNKNNIETKVTIKTSLHFINVVHFGNISLLKYFLYL